ncbi:MAG TPA: hypothetical protein VH297_08665, partial [Gaiellaceae bacterium]
MNADLQRLRDLERWIGWVRLGAVGFAFVQIAIASSYPSDYRIWAWITTSIFAVGTLVLLWLGRRAWSRRG